MSIIGPDDRPSPGIRGLELLREELTSPLVHEDLLDLDRQATGRVREALMHPARELTAPKLHVLSHVEVATEKLERREVADEAIDELRPAISIQRSRADVDLGVERGIVGGLVWARAAMIVRMQIQDDEVAEALLHLGEHPVGLRVECIVRVERSLQEIAGRLALPDLEPPGIFG
jgi:hypothetical protein